MIGLFALCNLLLGFGEPSTVDDFVLNLVGGVVDRPWTLLEYKYGESLADFAWLFKLRVLTFVSLELALFLCFLLFSGLWLKFFTPFPTEDQEVRSLIEQGDLRSVRGYSQWEWFMMSHFGFMIFTKGLWPRTGVKTVQNAILVLYLFIAACFPFMPMSSRRYEGLKLSGNETELMILFFLAVIIIWLTPLFLVTVCRKLLGNPAPA
mgnify:FL=1